MGGRGAKFYHDSAPLTDVICKEYSALLQVPTSPDSVIAPME